MSLIEVLTLINTIFIALTYIDGHNKIAPYQPKFGAILK